MKTVRTLTRRQLQDLEGELHSERARVERSLRSREAADQQGSGEYDSADGLSSGNGGIGVELQTDTVARLEAIVAALARLADGTYGSCSSCREPIAYGRLLVMPETTLCVACGRA